MADQIRWDDAAMADMLESMDGPVGRWLAQKSAEMTSLAQAGAPVQKVSSFSWGKRSSSYLPRSMGYLKGSVHAHMGYTQSGQLFGGTNAAYGPTLFLEQPARQMHDRVPFMSNALYAAIED